MWSFSLLIKRPRRLVRDISTKLDQVGLSLLLDTRLFHELIPYYREAGSGLVATVNANNEIILTNEILSTVQP